MTSYDDAFDISPVPAPGRDTEPPEIFRGIYGMPMFLTVRTTDLDRSAHFWTAGLGFIELFTIPGQLIHLRRWAFQDVLLMPTAAQPCDGTAGRPAAPAASHLTLSVACVRGQLEGLRAACEELVPGCTRGPVDRPWNSTEVEVTTPEGTHVVLTAANPLDPDSAAARRLADIGIDVRRPTQ